MRERLRRHGRLSIVAEEMTQAGKALDIRDASV
jgi:hypothetical protein